MELPRERSPAAKKTKETSENLLIRAIEDKDSETVKFLLANDDGKFIKTRILNCAILNDNREVLEYLMSDKAEPKPKKKTPLLSAVESGDLEVVKLLLGKEPSIHEDPDLLVSAVLKENIELVELLIHHGSNVNAKSQAGTTPLSQAVALDNVEMTRLLLSNGAEPKNDTEILSIAVAESSKEVIEILLQNGADPNARNQETKSDDVDPNDERASLQLAMDLGDKLCYERYQKGRTALHLAADMGREDALRLLLAYGADIDCKTSNGLRTPLIIAADSGHAEIARVLLEADAAMDIADQFKRTAFNAAAMNGHMHILGVLSDFCFSDPEFVPKNGIYRFSYVKRTLFGNAFRGTKLEQWPSFVSVIPKHVLKVHAAGLKTPVGLNILINFVMDSNPEFFDACALELQALKTQYIGDSGVTFFQFLLADLNSLAVLARNASVNRVLKLADKEDRFTLYGSILMTQLRKGVARRDLMERGIAVGPRLVPDFQVPDLVIEKILQNLSNKDINAFIIACSSRKELATCKHS